MPLIDISRTLNARIAVWPGDTPFAMQPTLAIADGASVNLTTLTLSAHTGTHADAPYHFAADGATLEQIDLTPYWGSAQVVTVAHRAGMLTPEDITHVALDRAPRLLVRSGGIESDPTCFPEEIVYPGPALIELLAQHGVILYGADTPSMDAIDSKTLPGHHALRQHGIAILEGLDLSGAPDGLYELAALPLKIEGGDGSPVRAVLRTMELK